MVSELAGTLTKERIDVNALREQFFNPQGTPVPVKFGTSGHRGCLGAGFCALHARAIAQAVARIHQEQHIEGPILVGGDTRLMSRDTANLCAEVLAGNGLTVILPDMPLPTLASASPPATIRRKIWALNTTRPTAGRRMLR